jgi:hypothetical protein
VPSHTLLHVTSVIRPGCIGVVKQTRIHVFGCKNFSLRECKMVFGRLMLLPHR